MTCNLCKMLPVAVLAFMLSVIIDQSHAQSQPPIPKSLADLGGTKDDDVPESPEDDEGDDDELDSLLDLAEQDVGGLSTVTVTKRNAVAPALQTEVSTVSRQKSTVGRSPAAVFVISNEMIKRSGARSIPELLRMAPGVQVAKIDSSKWSVSIRGSNGRFANKLLVQIDGRTVYTPLFGGVFWDVQDVVLEDIERIEVIRGPGASVWGANAVNGVINVITKNASETHGRFVQGGIGTEERGFASARHGWQTASGVDMRVYGKWFERDAGFLTDEMTHDDWRMGRGGFRADWKPDCCSTVTFQGDAYRGTTGRENTIPSAAPPFSQRQVDDANLNGWNSLLRYTRTLSSDSDWSLQTYYDRTERKFDAMGFGENRDTVDIDFQYRYRWREDHSIIWGAGYRNSRDAIDNAPFWIEFQPSQRTIDTFSYFAQDEITLLTDQLYLTAGAKFSHSDFTAFEFQPTIRMLWTPTERHSIWASYSRAMRSPTRAGQDVRLTLLQAPSAPGAFPRFTGSPRFVAENLDAWEIGMRAQPTSRFSWDAAAFYFDYDDQQISSVGAPFFSPGPPPAVVVPVDISNGGEGRSYGFEVTSNYELDPCWRIHGSYSYLHEEMDPRGSYVGASPRNQIYVQSSADLTARTALDVVWRYVDNLSGEGIPSYRAIDVRLGWNPTKTLELSLVGRNLLDSDHPEFGTDGFIGNIATNVQREAYGMVSWRY